MTQPKKRQLLFAIQYYSCDAYEKAASFLKCFREPLVIVLLSIYSSVNDNFFEWLCYRISIQELFHKKQVAVVCQKFNSTAPVSLRNYKTVRSIVLTAPQQERLSADYGNNLFIHLTYSTNGKTFPVKLQSLCRKYFFSAPIIILNQYQEHQTFTINSINSTIKKRSGRDDFW